MRGSCREASPCESRPISPKAAGSSIRRASPSTAISIHGLPARRLKPPHPISTSCQTPASTLLGAHTATSWPLWLCTLKHSRPSDATTRAKVLTPVPPIPPTPFPVLNNTWGPSPRPRNRMRKRRRPPLEQNQGRASYCRASSPLNRTMPSTNRRPRGRRRSATSRTGCSPANSQYSCSVRWAETRSRCQCRVHFRSPGTATISF